MAAVKTTQKIGRGENNVDGMLQQLATERNEEKYSQLI